MKQLLIILLEKSFSSGVNSQSPSVESENIYSIADSFSSDKFIFYDGEILSDDFWRGEKVKKFVALGSDEQERVLNAFVKGFLNNYESILLIKSNSHGLHSGIVAEAFAQLYCHEYVIGPASDGGVYLLGMNKLEPFLFERDPSCTEFISILAEQNRSYYQLPILEIYQERKNLMNDLKIFNELLKRRQMIFQN